jgi:luciferase-type oxidoreductase
VTGAVILPIRHPIDTAKSAATLQSLSQGRLVLGVASGDRPAEYAAFGREWDDRGSAFRENYMYFKALLNGNFPDICSELYGNIQQNLDLVPDSSLARDVPILIVGQCQQDLTWIANHADAWASYPRPIASQSEFINRWNNAVEGASSGTAKKKPFAQSLYIDLAIDPDEPASAIHLGFRAGRLFLMAYLYALKKNGCSHVVLNLKYGRRAAAEVADEIATFVLPHFPSHSTASPLANNVQVF